jgi:Rieske Fe-S protein
MLIDGAVALGVAIPGLRFFAEPLSRRRKGRSFVRVTPLDGVPEGRPIRMVVTADRYDAYIHYPPGPIGQVWLIRNATPTEPCPPPSQISNLKSEISNLKSEISKGGGPPELPLSKGGGTPGGEPRVRCFQTICPHLGCGIDLVPDGNGFACPCHASGFDADGRRQFGPSPRDMDQLECRVSLPDENGRRWIDVRYQEFQTGVADRRVIG